MKKILFGVLVLTLVLVGGVSVPVFAAAPNWDITGTWVFNDIYLGTPYVHTMVINSFDQTTGAFSGTGFYTSLPSLTWTITGTVDGSTVNYLLTVLTVAPGVTIAGTGTISSSGSLMSGTGYQSNLPGTNPNVEWTAIGTAVNLDPDGDGILGSADKCPTSTSSDIWGSAWGTNRWQVMGSPMAWYQNKPAGKGTTVATWGNNMAYTYGCNGHQILNMLKAKFGSAMNGHYKFGLSSGLLGDFHKDMNDGVLDGRYFIETVTVLANKSTDTLSSNPLVDGVNYVLKTSGTAYACNESGCVIRFDADYSTSDATNWVDGVAPPYDSYTIDLLDLKFNNSFVNWGAYNVGHTYEYSTVGAGVPATFRVYDVYYPNNTGNLTVDIYAQL